MKKDTWKMVIQIAISILTAISHFAWCFKLRVSCKEAERKQNESCM